MRPIVVKVSNVAIYRLVGKRMYLVLGYIISQN